MAPMDNRRNFLKTDVWDELRSLSTDQEKQLPPPPVQKPCDKSITVDLIMPEDIDVGEISIWEIINKRKSHRKYTDVYLTLEELSFLLWSTQGVKKVFKGNGSSFRTVPSAGARHPFETYLLINRVDGISPGLYRYLALEHKLAFLHESESLVEDIGVGCNMQHFVGTGAVVFIWTVIPYRTEWRYSVVSPKIIALDAGHLCQNLYLACEAIGAGTCAIGAYHQKRMDAILKVDGKEEFVIYLAPVGEI